MQEELQCFARSLRYFSRLTAILAQTDVLSVTRMQRQESNCSRARRFDFAEVQQGCHTRAHNGGRAEHDMGSGNPTCITLRLTLRWALILLL